MCSGLLWRQRQPDVHRKFQANQEYVVRPCLKNNNKNQAEMANVCMRCALQQGRRGAKCTKHTAVTAEAETQVALWSGRDLHDSWKQWWKDSWSVFNKNKHTVSLVILPLYISPGELEVCSYKSQHVSFHSNLIYYCQDLEAAKVSFSRWKGKWYYGMTSTKKKWVGHKRCRGILLNERPSLKCYILDFNCMIVVSSKKW